MGRVKAFIKKYGWKGLLIMWCEYVIANYKQYYPTPPHMGEIVHYTKCRRCINEIKHQGWLVGFSESDGKVVEVNFFKIEDVLEKLGLPKNKK